MREFLARLKRPLLHVVHIGAGQGTELPLWREAGARSITLIEADPEAVEHLSSMTAGEPGVTVIEAAVSADTRPRPFWRMSFPELSALSEPTGLKELFPGLRIRSREEVQPADPVQLIASCDLSAERGNLLVLEAPGEAIGILKALQKAEALTVFDAILVQEGVEPLYEQSVPVAEIQTWPGAHGYEGVFETDPEDPERPHFMAVIDRRALEWERRLIKMAEQLAQAQAQLGEKSEALVTLAGEVEVAGKALIEARGGLESRTKERDAARAQAEESGKALTEARGALESRTKERDAARAQAEESGKALTEARGALESRTKERDAARAQAEESGKALTEARGALESRTKERDAARAQAEESGKALTEARGALESRTKERDAARAQAEESGKALTEARGALESRTKERDAARAQAEESGKALTEAREALESCTKERDAARAQAEESGKALIEARGGLESRTKERDAARQNNEQSEKSLNEIRVFLKTAEETIAARDKLLAAEKARGQALATEGGDKQARAQQEISRLRAHLADVEERAQRGAEEARQARQDLAGTIKALAGMRDDLDDMRARHARIFEEKTHLERLIQQLTPRLKEAAEQLRHLPLGEEAPLAELLSAGGDKRKKSAK